MRYVICLIVLCLGSMLHAETWTPPENPDPQAILHEALADAKAGRHETALAKHVWFHEKALSVNPHYRGVRLSFAMGYWAELGKAYPPALEKLKQYRDESEQKVLEGTEDYGVFHEMSAMNRALEEDHKTLAVFETLDEKQPKAARRVFIIAKDVLIKHKRYKLVGKYVQPELDYANALTVLRLAEHMSKTQPELGEKLLAFNRKHFAHDMTTLVAILVVNDRKDEAAKIAKVAREAMDDETFHATMDKALEGNMPEPQ